MEQCDLFREVMAYAFEEVKFYNRDEAFTMKILEGIDWVEETASLPDQARAKTAAKLTRKSTKWQEPQPTIKAKPKQNQKVKAK